MTSTHRLIAPRHFRFGSVTKMMVTLVLVLLPELFFAPVRAEVRQLQASVQANSNDPTVKIPQGTFNGTTMTPPGGRIPIEAFLGIPYALPPTDLLRFSPPVHVGENTTTFDAKKYKHMCIQVNTTHIMGYNSSDIVVDKLPDVYGNEDCLYLNVFRPSGTSQGQKLPVVVYIHGGAFAFGSGASRNISSMVAAPKAAPIIGVSMNYRLGVFGFLSASVGAKAKALNLGLQDQQLALKWVKANIGEFGGDPTKVTIMGSSAGGHSVGHHLQSPRSAGLFHQAIMESGAATARFCHPYNNSLNRNQTQAFIKAAGITTPESDEAQIISELRALNTSTIRRASIAVWRDYFYSDVWAFQPVIDGPDGVIPVAPIDVWKSGNWSKVPILTGFCNDEGTPFVSQNITTGEEFKDFFKELNPEWNATVIEQISTVYPDPLTNSTYPTQYSRTAAAYGQFAYIAPVRQTAHYYALNSLQVFLYHVKLEHTKVMGTGHDCLGRHVAYDYGTVNSSTSQKNLALSVNAFWVRFITTGNPNIAANAEVAAWPRYEQASNGLTPSKMVFWAGNHELAGGANDGVLFQTEMDTEFIKESDFWWGKVIQSEN